MRTVYTEPPHHTGSPFACYLDPNHLNRGTWYKAIREWNEGALPSEHHVSIGDREIAGIHPRECQWGKDCRERVFGNGLLGYTSSLHRSGNTHGWHPLSDHLSRRPMIRKAVFILAHEMGDPSFFTTYRKLQSAQWRPEEELRRDQEKALKRIISFSYEEIPYYRSLFKSLNLLPGDIRSIEDLEKLPVLTKETIKAHWSDFTPVSLSSMKYSARATGGSTGAPLQYRLSNQDRFFGVALLYRGWGYGGYDLGDRMVFLAGTSLDVGRGSRLSSTAQEIARNILKLSSFDMGDPEMRQYATILASSKTRFLRGYASSIYFFARWLEENDVSVPALDAVFTTAEKLFPHARMTIERVFGCRVYDNYGLNDGGISAFECSEHAGLHIDSERGLMEIVDRNDRPINEGEGRILATSLYNFAMPFIRYDTGDAGVVADDICPCGRPYPLLKEILGRQQEMLFTPGGGSVHGGFINHIFWQFPHVKEFQVVQKEIGTLIINIVPEPSFEEKEMDEMRMLLDSQGKGWDVQFRLVDEIDRSRAGKYKYIINEMGGV